MSLMEWTEMFRQILPIFLRRIILVKLYLYLHVTLSVKPNRKKKKILVWKLHVIMNFCQAPKKSVKVTDFLQDLWKYINKSGQSEDFVKLALSLMSGKIQKDNMAWLTALHMGRYSNSSNTCNMKYDACYIYYLDHLY